MQMMPAASGVECGAQGTANNTNTTSTIDWFKTVAFILKVLEVTLKMGMRSETQKQELEAGSVAQVCCTGCAVKLFVGTNRG